MLLKQFDDCPMGEPTSAVFSDTYMCKTDFNVPFPAIPLFYKAMLMIHMYVERKTSETYFSKIIILIILIITTSD